MNKLLDYLKELGYESCPENKKGDFSSMGAVRKGYEKDGLRFVFGLNEKGKPPTLIFPRPDMREFRYIEENGERKLVLTHRWDDDIMNIVLMRETPEKIYKSIVEKKGVFIINSTFEDCQVMENTEKVTFKIINNGNICVLRNRKDFYETAEEAIFEAKKFKDNPKEMFPQLTDELVKKYKNSDFLIFDSKNQYIATV